MKNYRPRILQSDWSIASRHGRTMGIVVSRSQTTPLLRRGPLPRRRRGVVWLREPLWWHMISRNIEIEKLLYK